MPLDFGQLILYICKILHINAIWCAVAKLRPNICIGMSDLLYMCIVHSYRANQAIYGLPSVYGGKKSLQ